MYKNLAAVVFACIPAACTPAAYNSPYKPAIKPLSILRSEM